MRLRLTRLVFCTFAMALSASQALSAESAQPLTSAPIEYHDFESLQRGVKLYMGYCSGCHSLQYQRYSRTAEDLGISEDIARRNLTAGEELFTPMLSAMDQEQSREWFNQAVPSDLSVIARSRGADWLYTFLKSFYRDQERLSGWNNLVFENTAMPNVLHDLQGSWVLDENGELAELTQGTLNAAEFDTAVADIVNFLVYVGEPARNTRMRIGYGVMIFLSFFIVVVYMTYHSYWKDIK